MNRGAGGVLLGLLLALAPARALAQDCKSCWLPRCHDLASFFDECPRKKGKTSECVSCWTAACEAMASFGVSPCEEKTASTTTKKTTTTTHKTHTETHTQSHTETQTQTHVTKRLPPPPEERLTVSVDLPPSVVEGSNVEVHFSASHEAWLIVYYLEGNGKGQVLWPSEIERAPHVTPGQTATLPSAAEKRDRFVIEAQLRKRGVAAHETFVVYAFRDKAEFERARPAHTGKPLDGRAFADALEKKLASTPPGRWAQAIIPYRIEPKGPEKNPPPR